jgi:hypothetical protein
LDFATNAQFLSLGEQVTMPVLAFNLDSA